jgi:secreted trypsin-like serine protease
MIVRRLSAVAAVATFALAPAGASAVVAGTPVAAGAYPFTVAIVVPFEGQTQACGATLVAPRRVVTAAHCIDAARATGRLDVVIGRERLSDDVGQRVRTTGVVMPKARFQGRPSPDVAVLRLARPVTGIAFPRLATTSELTALRESGATTTVIGWGGFATTRPDGRFLPETVIAGDRLREGAISLVPDLECESLVGSTYAPARTVCGSRPGVRGGRACYGDSGGPLIVRAPDGGTLLVGVVSRGIAAACGQDGLPDLYSRVDVVRGLITAARPAWRPIPAKLEPGPTTQGANP